MNFPFFHHLKASVPNFFYNVAAAVPMKQRLSVFDREDSDEDDGPSAASDVSRVNAQLSRRNAVLEQSMAAAATDDIYDYDGAYDSFKAKEVTTHKLSQAASTREAPVRIID